MLEAAENVTLMGCTVSVVHKLQYILSFFHVQYATNWEEQSGYSIYDLSYRHIFQKVNPLYSKNFGGTGDRGRGIGDRGRVRDFLYFMVLKYIMAACF